MGTGVVVAAAVVAPAAVVVPAAVVAAAAPAAGVVIKFEQKARRGCSKQVSRQRNPVGLVMHSVAQRCRPNNGMQHCICPIKQTATNRKAN